MKYAKSVNTLAVALTSLDASRTAENYGTDPVVVPGRMPTTGPTSSRARTSTASSGSTRRRRRRWEAFSTRPGSPRKSRASMTPRSSGREVGAASESGSSNCSPPKEARRLRLLDAGREADLPQARGVHRRRRTRRGSDRPLADEWSRRGALREGPQARAPELNGAARAIAVLRGVVPTVY